MPEGRQHEMRRQVGVRLYCATLKIRPSFYNRWPHVLQAKFFKVVSSGDRLVRRHTQTITEVADSGLGRSLILQHQQIVSQRVVYES